jgi:hypothetical protein
MLQYCPKYQLEISAKIYPYPESVKAFLKDRRKGQGARDENLDPGSRPG